MDVPLSFEELAVKFYRLFIAARNALDRPALVAVHHKAGGYGHPAKDETLAIFFNGHFVQEPEKFPDCPAETLAMVKDPVPDVNRSGLTVAVLAAVWIHDTHRPGQKT